MSSFKIPPSSDDESAKEGEKKPERIVPEFVFLEKDIEDENLGATPQDPRQMFGSIETMAKGKHPFYLRILSFLGLFIMLAMALVAFALFLITLTLSLLFARQVNYFNVRASGAWNWFKKFLVFSLGCFVSIFNFSLGLGIVLMYFMLRGEKFQNRFFQEFTNNQKR